MSSPSAGSAALAYGVYRATTVKGWERAASVLIVALSTVNLIFADSGTAALALVLLVALAMVVYAYRFLVLGLKLHPVALFAPIVLAILLLTPNPLTDGLSSVIGSKTGTSSFANRTAADVFSLRLVGDTLGVGVGMGANRPSSFLVLVLSTVGVVGFVLLAVVMVRALRPGFGPRATRAAAVGLVALLTAKAIAEPALSTPLIWLTLGLLMSARVAQGEAPRHPHTSGERHGRDGERLAGRDAHEPELGGRREFRDGAAHRR